MLESCRTNRDRYSWRKWIRLWREVQEMNRVRKAALQASGKAHEYREDILPTWDPTWKKRKGELWVFDLRSHEEELECWEEREYAKEWGRRPPYVEHNTDENSSFWSDMSSKKKAYSDDDSFDSGNEYNSDF